MTILVEFVWFWGGGGGGVGEGDVLLGVSVHNLAFCMFLVVHPILGLQKLYYFMKL